MFALAPASRWGYFVYPAGLLGWLWLSGQGQGQADGPLMTGQRDPVPALTASQP